MVGIGLAKSGYTVHCPQLAGHCGSFEELRATGWKDWYATVQATEAAITNALLAAETTTGANDLRVYALPVDRMLAAMRKYGRMP